MTSEGAAQAPGTVSQRARGRAHEAGNGVPDRTKVDLYPVNPFKEAGGMETCVQVEFKCYHYWGSVRSDEEGLGGRRGSGTGRLKAPPSTPCPGAEAHLWRTQRYIQRCTYRKRRSFVVLTVFVRI